MVKFIDEPRCANGGEPICETLSIAPASYYGHLAKRADPTRPSDHAKRVAQRQDYDREQRISAIRKMSWLA